MRPACAVHVCAASEGSVAAQLHLHAPPAMCLLIRIRAARWNARCTASGLLISRGAIPILHPKALRLGGPCVCPQPWNVPQHAHGRILKSAARASDPVSVCGHICTGERQRHVPEGSCMSQAVQHVISSRHAYTPRVAPAKPRSQCVPMAQQAHSQHSAPCLHLFAAAGL